MKIARNNTERNRLASPDFTLETRTMLAGTSVTGVDAIQEDSTAVSSPVQTLENPDSAAAIDLSDVDSNEQSTGSSSRERNRPRRARNESAAQTESVPDAVATVSDQADASPVEAAGAFENETSNVDDTTTADTTTAVTNDLADQSLSLEEAARPTNNSAPIDTDTPDDVSVSRPDADNFTLVWSDEFNTRDRRKWTATNRDTNDRSTNYPDSEGNRRDFRRLWRASNTSINEEEGALNVQTKLTNRDPNNRDDPNQVLAGARYISRDAFKPSDAEGGAVHIEARVRFPRAQGPHTAFWLLPPDGQLNPLSDDLTGADGAEIDIFEANAQRRPVTDNERNAGQVRERPDGTRFLSTNNFEIVRGNDGRDYVELPNTVRSGYHINGYTSVPSNVNARSRHRERLNTGQDNIYDTWQNVGITWSEDKLEIYWEGELIDTIDDPVAIPLVAEQILFSSQITSPGFGGDLPDDLSELDDQGLEVDWVRVFHQNADPSQLAGQSPATPSTSAEPNGQA